MKRTIFSFCLLVFSFVSISAQVNIHINAGLRGPEIGKNHYGVFFEEINHAGDGGLYAELVRNRSLEDNTASPEYWTATGSAALSLITTNLLNDTQKQALHVNVSTAGGGVYNSGFWGMNFEAGKQYRLSFWVKTALPSLTFTLQNNQGGNCGSFTVETDAPNSWQKYSATITASVSTTNGRLAITAPSTGSFDLDMVSLFPPTFKNRENGCRIDLAEKLEAMKPGFMRFPGGCYVEGEFADGNQNRFEWKKTIGPIENRPGHLNKNWNYRVSDGLGYHEFLQLGEDLGAEPLFVVNIGLGHGYTVNYQNIGEYIQEALDAIEYANGDASTTYGAMRIANGHPEPFNLRLIEIGNENYQTTTSQQSDHYAERYEQFRTAILEKYPDVILIGNVEAWGTDNPTWRNAHPVDMVDEHYYRNPAWFVGQYNKYDASSRSQHKIYVGEYAVTSNFGTTGNLNAALGEAVYMCGMENNSDLVVMNSYAPIFVNENDQNWKPDMIRFNASTAFGTPSYYIQQLFPNNVGKQNVIWTEENNTLSIASGKVGAGTWNTAATFADMQITAGNNTIVLNSDWNHNTGTWTISNSVLTQSSTVLENCTSINQAVLPDAYTYTLTATKTGGSEGFLIIFNYIDANNYCWWNIGGWANAKHGIEQCVNGAKSTLTSVDGTLATGRAYNIKIEVSGTQAKCYLDNALLHEVSLPVQRNIYTAASIDDETGFLYVKLINPNSIAHTASLNIANAGIVSAEGILLTASSGDAENTMANPVLVAPQNIPVSFLENTVNYSVPAFSANILKFQLENIRIENTTSETPPAPVIKYSFEKEPLADDSGDYPATLAGAAEIRTMNDGNRVFFSGAPGNTGYLDLSVAMGKTILAGLTGDFSISIDLMNGEPNTLSKYCWAYAFSNSTTRYIGLINAGGNGNWYYEIKNTAAENVKSGSGLAVNQWHNLTYTQQGTTGKIYSDGFLLATTTVNARPADIAASLTTATLSRSPFTADAYMQNTYFDNFQLFDQALTAGQVQALYETTQSLSNAGLQQPSAVKNIIPANPKDDNAPVFDILGRYAGKAKDILELKQGIYIINSRKIIVTNN
ncbi:MAG: carbohydrate binding domain-containing protein [Dysgonamonadaceae bacterium]|jgi:alpha-L-arabinofuranosidase|nr:carbohydrate binding domain-containing protein [Dysgonamonadaceae bacterium]